MTTAALKGLLRQAKSKDLAVAGEREKREHPVPSVDLLQDMALDAFRESGLVVVVRCALLGEEVVFAADGTPTARHGFDDRGRVVYSGDELRLLVALSPRPEDLVGYHALRKGTGRVTVEAVTPTPADLPPIKTTEGAA